MYYPMAQVKIAMSAGFNRSPFLSPSRIIIKTISLHDWWLVNGNADESNLGLLKVAGIGSKDGKLRTVFFSSAISERHDSVTLETIDGFMITLIGCINRSATRNNGFSVEVCNCFQFGFPCYWKDYASLDESSMPMPMAMDDDIPVSFMRDAIMFGSYMPMKFDDGLVRNKGEDITQREDIIVQETINGEDNTQREDIKVQETVTGKKRARKLGSGLKTRRMLEALSPNNDGVEERNELGMSSVRRSSRLKALRK